MQVNEVHANITMLQDSTNEHISETTRKKT